MAEPRGEDLRLATVLRDTHQTAARRRVGVSGLEEIEVAGRVGFQASVEGVLALACVPVATQALVKVRLAVAVAVVQSGQLTALQDNDLAVNHLQTQRLIQTRGETLPGQLFQAGVGPLDQPDVAVSRADDNLADGRRGRRRRHGQEVDAGQEHQGLVRVLVRNGQRVNDQGSIVGTAFAPGGDRLGPACWSWFGQGLEIGRPRTGFHLAEQRFQAALVRVGQDEFDSPGLVGGFQSHLNPSLFRGVYLSRVAGSEQGHNAPVALLADNPGSETIGPDEPDSGG